jgi:IMP cyclohydrolase
MSLIDLKTELENNSYPGRGIIIGKSEDGEHAVIAYFIMGRSENSRNRIFEDFENGIRTKAFDESKLVDPSLIIYAPVRVIGNQTIVTNGDQTDTVFEFIKEGKTFEEALRTRTFEPDPPNFTPRISGIVENADGTFSYKLSILKSNNGNEASSQRFFYEYAEPVNGEGHFIHTYRCDGNPIPSFYGEPKAVTLTGTIDSLTETLWNSLNEENKVSLFTRYINLKTGAVETRIVNKNQ